MVLLVLLLIIVPIVELAIIIQVGSMIGVWWTIGLLIADSLFGAWLLMREGSRSWLRFKSAIGNGKVPAKETADGGLVISGGALLITPGFLTDIVGLLFLFEPTRAVIRRITLSRAIKYAAASAGGPAGWTLRGAVFGSRAA
ncbi:MAG: FxsA family protein, partial [Actinobacteria bacterium]|nr:FxsA family protein [Actinomycetota bacterium]